MTAWRVKTVILKVGVFLGCIYFSKKNKNSITWWRQWGITVRIQDNTSSSLSSCSLACTISCSSSLAGGVRRVRHWGWPLANSQLWNWGLQTNRRMSQEANPSKTEPSDEARRLDRHTCCVATHSGAQSPAPQPWGLWQSENKLLEVVWFVAIHNTAIDS